MLIKCPSMDEWISKMWDLQTMEYYSALKRKEILTQATTWMNLKNSILVKETRHRRTILWLHLCEVPRAVTFIGTENRMVVARGKGK